MIEFILAQPDFQRFIPNWEGGIEDLEFTRSKCADKTSVFSLFFTHVMRLFASLGDTDFRVAAYTRLN